MAPPVEAMTISKPKRKNHESNNRYRLYLENQTKTVKELAACMHMTYEGVYATVYRMIKRNQIKVVKRLPNTRGKSTIVLTWVRGNDE